MSIDERLEQAHDLLQRWESWTGEFEKSGCEDPDFTLTAHRLMGEINACRQLSKHSKPLEYIEDVIYQAHELVKC